MRHPLQLDQKPFDLSEWVVACGENLEIVPCLEGKGKTDEKGNPALVNIPFFGTVLVGFDTVPDDRWINSAISEASAFRAPMFSCPGNWTLAKILAALGVFKSIGDAKRNGWDKISPEGWQDHKIRCAKRQGTLTIITPTEEIKVPGAWDACEDTPE